MKKITILLLFILPFFLVGCATTETPTQDVEIEEETVQIPENEKVKEEIVEQDTVQTPNVQTIQSQPVQCSYHGEECPYGGQAYCLDAVHSGAHHGNDCVNKEHGRCR